MGEPGPEIVQSGSENFQYTQSGVSPRRTIPSFAVPSASLGSLRDWEIGALPSDVGWNKQ